MMRLWILALGIAVAVSFATPGQAATTFTLQQQGTSNVWDVLINVTNNTTPNIAAGGAIGMLWGVNYTRPPTLASPSNIIDDPTPCTGWNDDTGVAVGESLTCGPVNMATLAGIPPGNHGNYLLISVNDVSFFIGAGNQFLGTVMFQDPGMQGVMGPQWLDPIATNPGAAMNFTQVGGPGRFNQPGVFYAGAPLVNLVPEPGTGLLLGIGLTSLAWLRRRTA